MKDFIQERVEKLSYERAWWIDSVIRNAIPEWKLKLLLKYKFIKFLSKLINVNIEIIHETLIAQFGTRIIIKLNNKVIGDKMFSI